MSIEENKQLVRDFFGMRNRGDRKTSEVMVSDDVIWTLIGDTPVSGTFHGKRATMEGLTNKVLEKVENPDDIRMELIELIAEGDKVVARLQGSVPTINGPYNNTYCHVFTIRDGQIVEDIEFLDTVLIEKVLFRKKLVEQDD